MRKLNTRLTKIALLPAFAVALAFTLAILFGATTSPQRALAAPESLPNLVVSGQRWGQIDGPNQPFELQAGVSNSGAAATDVVLTIGLPPSIQLVPFQAHGCSEDSVANTVVCRKPVLENDIIEPALGVWLQLNAVEGGIFTITLQATAAQADADPADNIAHIVVDVPRADYAAIQGVVRDGNNDGLAGIDLLLHRKATSAGGAVTWESAGQQVTNSYGGYAFDRLAFGTYRVQFVDPTGTYAGEWYENAEVMADAQEIALSMPRQITFASAWLRRAGEPSQPGIVRGNIQNRVFEPLPGIRVSALQPKAVAADSHVLTNPPWTEVLSTTTDGAGNYVLAGLDKGSYYLRFADPGQAYRVQYYWNQRDWHAAETIAVEANLTRTVDATLELLPLGSLEGIVLDAQGQPLPDVTVTALRSEASDAAGWQAEVTAQTDEWGEYTFYNLPDGYYRLRYDSASGTHSSQFYHAAATLESARVLSITRGVALALLDEQMGVLAPESLVTGRLVDAEEQPLAEIRVIAYQGDGAQRAALGWRPVMTTTTDIQGSYQMYLPLGIYRLGFIDPGGAYVTSFYGGGLLLETAVDVTVPQNALAALGVSELARVPDQFSELLFLPVIRY